MILLVCLILFGFDLLFVCCLHGLLLDVRLCGYFKVCLTLGIVGVLVCFG